MMRIKELFRWRYGVRDMGRRRMGVVNVGKLESGRVISFKPKGFGFLSLKAGEHLWFHRNDHYVLIPVGKGRSRFVRRADYTQKIEIGDTLYFVRGFAPDGKERASMWCFEQDVNKRVHCKKHVDTAH